MIAVISTAYPCDGLPFLDINLGKATQQEQGGAVWNWGVGLSCWIAGLVFRIQICGSSAEEVRAKNEEMTLTKSSS